MQDINDMQLKDYYNLLKYLDKREKIKTHQPIKLKQSQIDMIKKTKEKNKKKE